MSATVPATFLNNPVGWRKARPYEGTLFAPIYPIKGGSTPPDPTIGDQGSTPDPNKPANNADAGATFTAAQVEAIRKQEKDKLYSQIQALQAEQQKANDALAAIQKAKDDELATVQAAQAKKEAELRAKQEEEMSAKALLEQKLQETNDTWESRFNAMQTEREQEKALQAKEREYNELVSYRNSALESAKDDIAPQFYDFISGDTKEQIDAGIARAKAATSSIAEQFQAAQTAQLSQMRGVSPTGYSATGPMENVSTQQSLSPADLQNMPMSEYAKLRGKLGPGSSEARNNRGLFG